MVINDSSGSVEPSESLDGSVGSVGQHYRSIYRPTLGRYINRVPINTPSIYRPRFDRVSVEHQPIYRRMCVDRYGFSVVDTRPIP